MTNTSMLDLETITAGRHYVLTTDGACKNNPGRGGWSVILHLKEAGIILRRAAWVGSVPDTTNIRMEMTAIVEGLGKMREDNTPALVVTDSEMTVKAMALGWIDGWKAKDWWEGSKPRKNADLWQELDRHRQERSIHWQWVRGHASHVLNETADRLASNAALGKYRGIGKGLRDARPELFA